MHRAKLRTSGYRKPAVQYDKDEGLVPWHEIASVMSMTPEGVRVVCMRALDKIRQEGMMLIYADWEATLVDSEPTFEVVEDFEDEPATWADLSYSSYGLECWMGV